MTKLTYLQLENTDTTNAGLAKLKSLKNLKVLTRRRWVDSHTQGQRRLANLYALRFDSFSHTVDEDVSARSFIGLRRSRFGTEIGPLRREISSRY